MRSIVEVIDKILKKLPSDKDKDPSVVIMRTKMTRIQNECLYKAPEVVVEDHYWYELSSAILDYKDDYHDVMWYCEIVAILSNCTYDEIVRAFKSEYKS